MAFKEFFENQDIDKLKESTERKIKTTTKTTNTKHENANGSVY